MQWRAGLVRLAALDQLALTIDLPSRLQPRRTGEGKNISQLKGFP
jgi:hypothetical protein